MSGIEAALASGVLKLAGGKLVSLLASEFASTTGVKNDLSELQDIHGEITSWLAAVRDRSIESDPQFRWVMKLKDVAYDIDDLLREVELEAAKHKIHRSSDTKRAILNSIYAKPKFGRKVAHKIKDIKVGYAAIVAQRRDANTVLHSLQLDQPVQSRIKATSEQTLLIDAGESKIPVRDQLKTQIVSKIVESNKGEDGHIVSIVGLGGSGKTTLAQHICHDDRIKDIFKSTIYWVHVSSQEFSKEKLIAKLFEAITEEKSDARTPQYVVGKISSELRGKKFLLVLDDAWHDKKQDWEQFMKLLNSGASGSMILLTTRDQNVANAVESKIIFNLGCLTEAESWSFFLKSSGWMEEDLNNDFIQVGKDIVKKCGGVPLPIKTLGSVLRDKTGINTWRAISESNLWDQKDIEGRVFASLKLSYIHMEDHLKQCFAFCSIFPKGYEIQKDYLIEQWIAHGFIKLMGEEQPDDIGNEYVHSLVKAGLFIVVDAPFGSPTNEPTCKMHDLIHELARYCWRNELVTSLRTNEATDYTQKCRYLSLTSGTKSVNRDQFDKVRALYMSDGNLSFDKQIKKGYHIRSIVVDNENFTPFPSFILKFEYLGYLEIHRVKCKKIPEAISGFWNLQSLHFINCFGFVTLPKSVGRLKKLRTLELNGTDLQNLPQSIGNCRDLQSLQLYSCLDMRNIPVSLGRNGGLRVLRIAKCSKLKQLPSELIGEFGNLQEIDFSYCWDLQDLPTTMSCPTLCTLDLSGTKVTVVPPWVSTICTLKFINLWRCSELVELPKDIGNLKRLSVLNINGCTNLKCMPSGIGQLTRLTCLGLFVVGCGGDDAKLSELGNLDKLSGRMEIKNLKYLKDPCDADKACLKQKNKILSLELDWSLSNVKKELASDVEQEQEQRVLSALEPPSQIENLEINGYQGPCLPRWMMEQNDSSFCEGITLEQAIPCQFLSLTQLKLKKFPNLKHMRGLLKFPSLKSLKLGEMSNLEELWTAASGFEILKGEVRRAQDCFPALSELSIWDCPKLSTVKPYFPPSLEKLCLSECNLQLLSPDNFSHLLPPPVHESSSCSSQHSEVPHLRKLQLEQIGPSSDWEFLQHRTELKTLYIERCNDLTQLPESIRSLTSLQKLHINVCHTLGVLPEWLGDLCSLRELDVSWTPKIASLPQSIGRLTSLTSLRIYGLENLKLLPDAIQHLASLRYLELSNCGALAELPECIGQLATRVLWIDDCPALECLPQSIQHLTALQSLFIRGCHPALASRYQKGVGPDWHLVSHIPDVTKF